MVFAVLNRMTGAGLPEKVTLGERLLGGEGANHANMRGRAFQGEASASAKDWRHWENFGFYTECHGEPRERLDTGGSWSDLHYKKELFWSS